MDSDEYSTGEMIDRIVYWWTRYEGTRTPKGKDYSISDLRILISRLQILERNPEIFNFDDPNMGVSY